MADASDHSGTAARGCRAVPLPANLVSIYVFPILHVEDEHAPFAVINGIDDPLVADPIAKKSFECPLKGLAGRTRVRRKAFVNLGYESGGLAFGQRLEVALTFSCQMRL